MLDDDFLKNIRARQEDALHKLYTEYRGKFIRVLVRNYTACDVELATELYQVAIALVYENIMNGKLSNLKHENSLWNYIYKTGKHKYTDWHRYQRRITKAPEEFFNAIPEEGEEENREELENLQTTNLAYMQEALAGLGNPCTAILELFYYENKSMKDITEILSYNNEKTTKTQKYKCLQRLKKAFHERLKNNQ